MGINQFVPNNIFQENLDKCSNLEKAYSTKKDCFVPVSMPLANSCNLKLFEGGLPYLPPEFHMGTSSLALPENWSREMDCSQPIGISILNDAFAFGGTIIKRGVGMHEKGQLIITNRGGLIPSSFGIMDGQRTLPGDLLMDLGNKRYKYIGPSEVPEVLLGTYLLIGNVHRHFGHFILEGLSRLWGATLMEPILGENIIFAVYENKLPGFANEFLTILGANNNKVISLPTVARVERLVIPDVSMRTHRWVSYLQGIPYKRIIENVQNSYPKKTASESTRRVYLSRAKVGERLLLNSEIVESIFQDFGYEIVCPETLSLQEQLNIAQSSISLAGEVGSQMYLAVFQPPGSETIVLAPRNFFLKDDFLLSVIGRRKLRVIFGDCIDFAKGKTEREWHIDPSLVFSLLL